MASQQLVTMRSVFDEAKRCGIFLWLESGWAIDARLGRITRKHEDIDIAFAGDKENAYRELLETAGFGRHQMLDHGFLSWKNRILLDSEPCFSTSGEYGFPGFPLGSCPLEKQGVINGYRIRCISWGQCIWNFWATQMKCLQKSGEEKTSKVCASLRHI